MSSKKRRKKIQDTQSKKIKTDWFRENVGCVKLFIVFFDIGFVRCKHVFLIFRIYFLGFYVVLGIESSFLWCMDTWVMKEEPLNGLEVEALSLKQIGIVNNAHDTYKIWWSTKCKF